MGAHLVFTDLLSTGGQVSGTPYRLFGIYKRDQINQFIETGLEPCAWGQTIETAASIPAVQVKRQIAVRMCKRTAYAIEEAALCGRLIFYHRDLAQKLQH